MLSPETSTLLTLCCYGAATVAGLAGMLLRNAFWRRLGCWLAGLGFVCQTFSNLASSASKLTTYCYNCMCFTHKRHAPLQVIIP